MPLSNAAGSGSLMRWRTPGLRGRLLVAFLGIVALAILAAAGAILAFRLIGGQLDIVSQRMPSAQRALEVSRSAERLIAAAPALVTAANPLERAEVNRTLAHELAQLDGQLTQLRVSSGGSLPVDGIAAAAADLTQSLSILTARVAQRVELSEQVAAGRRELFIVSETMLALLLPWLEVLAGQISAHLAQASAIDSGGADPIQQLVELMRSQRTIAVLHRQISAAIDLALEASTLESLDRVPVLDFQLRLALSEIEESLGLLDPRLRQLLLEPLSSLRRLAVGSGALPAARGAELALVEAAVGQLDEAAARSVELTAAVDALAAAAEQDIFAAVGDALSVQRIGTAGLVALVLLTLGGSVLIVWLYVGRNLVRRLTALNDGMLAIAGGELRTPMPVAGTDEIAAMGRAVEIFRQNTVERDALLAEQGRTAERLEREVRQRTAQLQAADRFKAQFLAAASHDLRQPLHALNLFAAQLPEVRDPAERDRLGERIGRAVHAMNELFDALLDMSKLEAGLLEPAVTDLAIEGVLRRIETTFEGAARKKGLSLRIVQSSAWIRSDAVLLERILLNLVSNAVRYTSHGRVLVGVRRRGERLRIDVYDSGPGIAADRQLEVFREFHQLPGADRRSGLGLGLAIVERLARLLGHELELHSRRGSGTRFSLSVPLLRAAPAAATVAEEPQVLDRLAGKVALMLDDDPDAVEGMAGVLRAWGCQVLQAATLTEAIAAIKGRTQIIDVIIADYWLGHGSTGIEAIERLRHILQRPVAAFLVSGDTTPERLREARRHGVHLLHKPVPPMRLRAILTQTLSEPRRPRAAE